MALKMILDSLDEVAEGLRSEYTPRDGKFVLNVQGVYSAADRDALQGALSRERDEHKQTRSKLGAFGDRTLEQFDELEAQVADLNLKLKAGGKDAATTAQEIEARVEERVNSRIGSRVKPLERQIQEREAKLSEASKRLDEVLGERARERISAAVTSPALLKELGMNLDAAEDISLWAERHFELDDQGRVVSRASLGTPGLSPKDVFTDLKANGQRKLWFGSTVGAGASGGGGGENFGRNPFVQGNLSLTEIGRVVKSDPQRAVRMAVAARGKDWDPTRYLPKDLQPQGA